MNLLSISFDSKKFTYVDSITLDGKNYVAYMDDENVYISEYTLDNGDITFYDVDDDTYNRIIKDLAL